MKNFILDLIYPPVCGICRQISEEHLCHECAEILKKYEINLYKSNKLKNIYYQESFFLYKYEDIIRHILIDYKFNNKSYLYKTFVKIILKNEKACGFLKKYDIIIPVPIHKNRRKTRGYNQTELIAKNIAKELNLNFMNNILIKKRNIIPQSQLSKIERKLNIKNAFCLQHADLIKNKKILIIDDIYTTGTTVNECAKLLKAEGCNKIGIMTLAKD